MTSLTLNLNFKDKKVKNLQKKTTNKINKLVYVTLNAKFEFRTLHCLNVSSYSFSTSRNQDTSVQVGGLQNIYLTNEHMRVDAQKHERI